MKKILLLVGFITLSSTAQIAGSGVTDIDGKFYPSVIIGEQEWMATNLQTGRYKDGTFISFTPYEYNGNFMNQAWITAGVFDGMYCQYNDPEPIYDDRGFLYNWYAVNGAGSGYELAPEGWHIPSVEEWQTLISYTDANLVDVMRKSGVDNWECGEIANDVYNFSAIGAGVRVSAFNNPDDGQYQLLNSATFFWSSTSLTDYNNNPAPGQTSDGTAYSAYIHCMNNSFPVLLNGSFGKRTGMAIRCVKNTSLATDNTIKQKVRIYPNPVQKDLNIQINEKINSIEIFDVLGKRVFYQNQTTNKINIDYLSKGVYLVKINTESQTFNSKIIKD